MTSPREPVVLETRSPEETKRLAVALTPLVLPGDVLSLSGDLGAGKTTFVQGLAASLGVVEEVTSPTFTIMKEYFGRLPLVHLDVYRLERMQEVLDLGFDELIEPSTLVVIEWGDVIDPLLPRNHLDLRFEYGASETSRNIAISPSGPRWEESIETIRILLVDLFQPQRDPLITGDFVPGEDDFHGHGGNN